MLKSAEGALIIVHEDKYQARATPVAGEVHLRRLTVDEALLKLDRYLNDAFMAGLWEVRVIHGKGTGTLRQAVREQLASHPLVKSYRPGGWRVALAPPAGRPAGVRMWEPSTSASVIRITR